MKPLSPNARRLIDLTQGQDEPNAASRSRVAHSLAGRIAAGVIVGAAGTSIPAAAASVGSASVGLGAAIAKSVLVVCVTGAVATTGYLKLRTPRLPTVQPRPAPATVSVPRAPAPAIQTPPALPMPDPIPRKSVRLAPRPEPKVVVPPQADHLHDEAEALRAVQQALRDGQGPQALRLLNAQDVRFREGLLQQERAAARVLALCQTGAEAKARAQAEDFQTRWPRSALIARIRFACWKP